MKYLLITGILLAFCSLSVSAQDQKEKLVWQTGTIQDQRFDIKQTEKEIYEFGSMKPNQVEVTRVDTQWIMLKTEKLTYFLSRKMTKWWQKRLKSETDSKVSYALDGDFMYLRTAKGKKLKYKIDNIFPN